VADPIEVQQESPKPQDAVAAAPAPAEARGVIAGGLLKGLAITALAIVGVMALVAGGMGMGSPVSLTVNEGLITTFGQGAAEGLSVGLKFLTTNLGLAALGMGAAFGAVSAHNSAREAALAAPDAADKTRVMELTKELEQQKSLNQLLVNAKTAETPAAARADGVAPAAAEAATPEKKDSIHIAGSVIKDRNFCASELKRRVERTENSQAKAF